MPLVIVDSPCHVTNLLACDNISIPSEVAAEACGGTTLGRLIWLRL